LVGEHNRALREVLHAVFRAEGYDVMTAANGIDLLDAVAVSLHPEFGSGEFDLVIAEARVLGAPALQSFRKLRGRAKVPPFVFITDFGKEELRAKARPFDAVAVLEKPLDLDNLRDLVNSFLRHPTEEPDRLPAGAVS
jgi:DNA-binding response OmpR family regulator